MAGAPRTLEGWYALHRMYAVDWPRWNALEAAERTRLATGAAAVLEEAEHPGDGHGAVFSLLSHKGDLLLMSWRRDLEALRRAELAFERSGLRAYLQPTYSYLSVIELGTYELGAHAAAVVQRKGLAAGTPEFEQAVQEEMQRLARPRLFPAVPPGRYVCFYPMSKRRGEAVNWFDLPESERATLMKGHGEIGRRYAGQVVQVISGSVGLDDWEWGVTLFADDPLVFKKLIYEMRFDPASSRYALFGPFYVGIRIPPSGLGAALG
jgi:hydrogen peroxide-dependent heme synthase